MQANGSRITIQSVFVASFIFLALMAWTARSSSAGESGLVAALRFLQIAIYGGLAVGTMWFGLRAVRRGERARPVPMRALALTVGLVLVITAAGLFAAVQFS